MDRLYNWTIAAAIVTGLMAQSGCVNTSGYQLDALYVADELAAVSGPQKRIVLAPVVSVADGVDGQRWTTIALRALARTHRNYRFDGLNSAGPEIRAMAEAFRLTGKVPAASLLAFQAKTRAPYIAFVRIDSLRVSQSTHTFSRGPAAGPKKDYRSWQTSKTMGARMVIFALATGQAVFEALDSATNTRKKDVPWTKTWLDQFALSERYPNPPSTSQLLHTILNHFVGALPTSSGEKS